MQHPFEVLKPEYTELLKAMVIVRPDAMKQTASRLLRNKALYVPVSNATGIPIVWIAASFEREASSNFALSPAQGDRWDRPSVHVPRNRGPFANWIASALDAYHLNGLDKVGATNWTWELACYYGEIFNGTGYRGYHREHSPYLWGGTNIQQLGKYTSDGRFDAAHMDTQLGIVPMMTTMVAMDSSLAFNTVPSPEKSAVIPAPLPVPFGLGGTPAHDASWIQTALNAAGQNPPLDVDGSFGAHTYLAVRDFQSINGLIVDGVVGKATIAALESVMNTLSKGI